METKNKIGYGMISLVLLLSLGINVLPDDTHYCQERNMTYHCDGFSKYYGLVNGKCINELKPNKLCRTGWEEIFRESSNEGEIIPKVPQGKSYVCNLNKCEEKINGIK